MGAAGLESEGVKLDLDLHVQKMATKKRATAEAPITN